MRKIVFIFLFVLSFTGSFPQKYSTEKGIISFFSDAPVEDIKAENAMVGSLFNSTTGELVYIVKIKDFIFPKALMREHFNEKYMETEKFPKALFQGKLKGYDPSLKGEQKVMATGKLTMHGVTREVEVPGTLQFEGARVLMKSKFKVVLQDYAIKIPKIVWQNIADDIEISINFIYKPL